MENLGWDNSQTLEIASSLWINNIIDQHHDHDDLDSLGGSNGSTDSSTILNPVQQQVMPPVLFGNSMELTTMSNFNFSNYNMVAKSEATPSTTNWGLFTSMINMPSNFDTILTKPSEQFLDHGFQGCTAQLDCLLSTTNSNHTDTTTTCIVYDGMCCCQVNETLSQSCSDPFVQTQITKCADNNKLNLATNRKNIDQRSFNFLLTDSSKTEGLPKSKKPRSEKRPDSTNINFQPSFLQEPDPEAIGQMKEMIYRAAAFRPVNFGVEVVDKPQRKNVKISSDPQTVAARQRRERISERIRVLQRLVPGGNKMDTASMLDEAVNYVKFLKSQIKALEKLGHKIDSLNYFPPTSFAFSSKYPSFPML